MSILDHFEETKDDLNVSIPLIGQTGKQYT